MAIEPTIYPLEASMLTFTPNNAVNMVDYMLFILTITRQAHTIKLAWFIYHVILFHRQKSMQLQGSYIVNDPVNFVIASI